MREIEKLLDQHSESSSYNNMINLDIQNLIKQAYNLGIFDSSNNLSLIITSKDDIWPNCKVDIDKILELKIN